MPLQTDREAPGAEGAARKAHYGDGRQPWDDIVDAGWAVAFAAGNVVKYMHRSKDPEHSLQSAQWYYKRLCDMAAAGSSTAATALRHLQQTLLQPEELVRLCYTGPNELT